MKQYFVVFTKTNARVVKGESPDNYYQYGPVLIQPDLSKVKGIPPHYWKIQDNQVIPMTKSEKRNRDKAIEREGVTWPPTAEVKLSLWQRIKRFFCG